MEHTIGVRITVGGVSERAQLTADDIQHVVAPVGVQARRVFTAMTLNTR